MTKWKATRMSVQPEPNKLPGNAYTQRPEVTQELAAARALSPAEWIAHAASWRAETVCSLARQLLFMGADTMFHELITSRIHPEAKGIAANQCKGLSPVDAEQVIEHAIGEVNRALLSKDMQKVHYVEVSFGQFVSRKAITASAQARRLSSISTPFEEDAEHLVKLDPQVVERMRREFDQKEEIARAIRTALPRFKPIQRAAFDYWFYDDMPIEALNPNDVCIARMVKRDKRTVYLWFAKIFEELKKELGEQS
jgi:hypothetical protein